MNLNLMIRRGVTLMETIFAIGVILTGLVGLTALIPIAAGNAKATMELDRSVSESTSMAAGSISRKFNRLTSLVIYDKPTAMSPAIATNPYGYAPTNFPQSVAWKLDTQMLTIPGIPPTFVTVGKLESPGYGHHPLGSGLTSGICIDPLGMPDASVWRASPDVPGTLGDPVTGAHPAVPATANAYEYSRFPYYSERYSVLTEPNAAVAAGVAPVWPMSPRMWRATFVSDLQDDDIAPVAPREQLPSYVARRLFQGFGGLSDLVGSENDDPRAVLLDRTNIGGAILDVGRNESSKYSWFATLTPPFLGGGPFRQSVVVVSQRVTHTPQRLGDPLALNQAAYAVTVDEDGNPNEGDNPNAERLAWIGQAIGFNGGSGGEVLMYGSAAVSPAVNPGEWIMLSRQPFAAGAPTGPAVHRWFRVLIVDEPVYGAVTSVLGEANWTGGADPYVWRRWVTLAGPDWSFGLGNTVAADLGDDTFCTIVTGAISVFESEVNLVP